MAQRVCVVNIYLGAREGMQDAESEIWALQSDAHTENRVRHSFPLYSPLPHISLGLPEIVSPLHQRPMPTLLVARIPMRSCRRIGRQFQNRQIHNCLVHCPCHISRLFPTQNYFSLSY